MAAAHRIAPERPRPERLAQAPIWLKRNQRADRIVDWILCTRLALHHAKGLRSRLPPVTSPLSKMVREEVDGPVHQAERGSVVELGTAPTTRVPHRLCPVAPYPACHAGGRGFESRRSRLLKCLSASGRATASRPPRA